MRSYWIVGVLNFSDSCPHEEKCVWRHRCTQRKTAMWRWRPRLERCSYKWRNAQDCRRSPEATGDSSLEPWKERGLPALWIQWILASITVREEISLVLSHSICANLLRQPQNTNTASINRISLELSHAHSFTYCTWLLSQAMEIWLIMTETVWPAKPKTFAFWSFLEKVGRHLV